MKSYTEVYKKAQKDMLQQNIITIAAIKFKENEESIKQLLIDVLDAVSVPEDAATLIESVMETDSIEELQRVLKVMAKLYDKMICLEVEKEQLILELNPLHEIAASVENANKIKEKQFEKLQNMIKNKPRVFGAFIYALVAEKSFKKAEEHTQIHSKVNEQEFNGFISALESNDIISPKEVDMEERKVLIGTDHNLSLPRNKMKLCSGLTMQYSKTGLSHVKHVMKLGINEFNNAFEELCKEGWYVNNGKRYEKGKMKSWSNWSLRHLIESSVR